MRSDRARLRRHTSVIVFSFMCRRRTQRTALLPVKSIQIISRYFRFLIISDENRRTELLHASVSAKRLKCKCVWKCVMKLIHVFFSFRCTSFKNTYLAGWDKTACSKGPARPWIHQATLDRDPDHRCHYNHIRTCPCTVTTRSLMCSFCCVKRNRTHTEVTLGKHIMK